MKLKVVSDFTVGKDDGFLLAGDLVAVLAGQHVHFSLVEAQLANVSFQEEDVGALHTRVEQLGHG